MLSDNKRSLRQIDDSRGRDVLELAEDHAEGDDSGAEEEEEGLDRLARRGKEVGVEDFVPSINNEKGDAEGEAHDWSEPEERRGGIVQAYVLVAH